jgi:hypothetical protein
VTGSIGEIFCRAAVGLVEPASIAASHRSTSFSVILRQFLGHFRGVPFAGAAHIAAIKAVSLRLVMEGFFTECICFVIV